MRRTSVFTRRAAAATPSVAAVAVGVLALQAAWPEPAHAVDLFPVDDWVGDGIKRAGDIALGPLKLGVKEIAGLIATTVGALADLLVPKSLVESGLSGVRWLVQFPPVGVDATPQPGVPQVRMPHLQQLRDTMTWIGLTLLPLGLIIGAGRAFLAPTADGDAPADLVGRVLVAGVGLVLYDWGWGVATELSHHLTNGILGLPWMADGVERMLETLLIGGATGSAVAAEFVVPLLILVAGTTLLALLLVRVGLEVATALIYVLGGLALGLSVTALGKRLLSAWLVAAGAIMLLPLLWSTVFAVGAALMLDAGQTAGAGGLAKFLAQLFNVTAAMAVFWIAIKLALGVFRHASGSITGITTTPASGGGVRGGTAGGTRPAARAAALAQNATPKGLVAFSETVQGRLSGGAAAARGAVGFPARHPVRAALGASYPVRHPVQATREAAGRLSEQLGAGARTAREAATRAGQRTAAAYQAERAQSRFTDQAARERRSVTARPTRPPEPGDRTRPSGPTAAATPTALAGREVPRRDPLGAAAIGTAPREMAGSAAPRPVHAPSDSTARPRPATAPRPVWLNVARKAREDRDSDGRKR